MYQYYNTMEYTIDGNILTMIMPFTEHNFNTYSEENFKKMGIPATVSIITNDESITNDSRLRPTSFVSSPPTAPSFTTENIPKMSGGTISYDELTNGSNDTTMTIPYKSFYMRMKYLTNMFDNKINDDEREGLFTRTFKEIPVIVNKGFQKIKHILDDINAPKIQRDEVEFHPVVVNEPYVDTVKDDNDEKLFAAKPVKIIETPQTQTTELTSGHGVPTDAPGVVPTDAPGVVPTDAPGVVPTDAPGVVPVVNKFEQKIKCVCIGEEKWCKLSRVWLMSEGLMCEEMYGRCVGVGVGVLGEEVMLCSVDKGVYYGNGEVWGEKLIKCSEGMVSELSKEVWRDIVLRGIPKPNDSRRVETPMV